MSIRAFDWVRDHKPHVATSLLMAVVLLPALWIALAYGGLPRLWSHHEHKKGKLLGEAVAYTAQDIPGDPINLKIEGSRPDIERAMQHAGWTKADDVSLASGMHIVTSVILGQPYPNAPVSPLYLNDEQQTIAYQMDEGKSADRRHHVRFWQVAPTLWYGSATFDRGVGFSLFTLQITHHIGPDVDQERDMVAKILASGDQTLLISQAGASPGRVRRNGGGDKYRTDGKQALIRPGLDQPLDVRSSERTHS